MKNVLRIYQGSQCIADGVTAWVTDGPLSGCEHALDVFPRTRATQLAVVDLGTKGCMVPITIRRVHASGPAATDAGIRCAQARTGQYPLVVEMDDATDTHQWTLSDMDGNGAAWKKVQPQSVNGIGSDISYEVTGGTWTYSGPLASTFSDTIGSPGNSALCNVVNSLLARVNFSPSIKLDLNGKVFAGTIVCGTTSIADSLRISANTALNGFTSTVLGSVAGTLNLGGCTALTVFVAQSLSNLTGTVACAGCTALATVVLAASVTTANGFTANFSGCALDASNVDAILAAFAAGLGSTTSGTINVSGGTNAAPTGGSSNADYLALTGAGITVFIS